MKLQTTHMQVFNHLDLFVYFKHQNVLLGHGIGQAINTLRLQHVQRTLLAQRCIAQAWQLINKLTEAFTHN
jgi:hypothetical protein